MLETFITVHDQDLVLRCEAEKKYSAFSDYKYLFVGQRPVDRLSVLRDKLIVARDYPHNIEQHKLLFDYTGWYCLVKNNLLKQPFVNLLQYDMGVDPAHLDLETVVLQKLATEGAVIGFIPANFRNIFPDHIFTLTKQVFQKHGLNLHRLIANEKTDLWATSNALAMSAKSLGDYMQWFEPFIPDLAQDQYGGHAAERMLKFYCQLHQREEIFLPGTITHDWTDSHGTTGTLAEKSTRLPTRLKNRLRFTLIKHKLWT